MNIALSLVMDVAVLMALAITIFYAVRLSNSLNAFKQNKTEFEAMVGTLSLNIQQAHDVIEDIKKTSGQLGDDLQEATSDAKYMLDEMRQVNDVSDSLATRLEILAQKGRQSQVPSNAVDTEGDLPRVNEEINDKTDDSNDEYPGDSEEKSWRSTLSMKMKTPADDADVNESVDKLTKSLFSIRDPDFPSAPDKPYEDARGGNKSFSSQAEKDLFEALKKKSN